MTDYEKLYNDAVKKMLDIIRGDEHPVLPKEIGLHLFPELKEQLQNEMFQRMAMKAVRTKEGQEIIKQNEVNPEDVIAWLNQEHTVTENKDKELMYSVGDWLIKTATNYNYPAYPVLVTDIKDDYYIFNNSDKCKISDIHKYKKWTLFDAKLGDVLVWDNFGDLYIFIYKDIKLNESITEVIISSYCTLNVHTNELEYIKKTISVNNISKITPATKEQSDKLFDKIFFGNQTIWDQLKKSLASENNEYSLLTEYEKYTENKPLSELSDEGYKMVVDYVMNADENKIVDVIKRCIRQTLYEGKEKTDALEWVTTHMTHSSVPQWVLDNIDACRKYICECTYNKNYKEYSTKLLRVQQWIESNHTKNNVTDNNA